LVNRLTGEVAELTYQEFKDSVDDKIATQFVLNGVEYLMVLAAKLSF
jgi:hypothetical protein